MKGAKGFVLCCILAGMICMAGLANAQTLEKNYRHAYGEVNIGPGGAQVHAIEEIVPSSSQLKSGLEAAGYVVTEYATALGSEIAAERMYAEKDGLFLDICYGLSVEQAAEVFANYEAAYETYYLMAQNEGYVYAVSDAKTFEIAGFASLETDGVLFIWK